MTQSGIFADFARFLCLFKEAAFIFAIGLYWSFNGAF